MSRLISDILEAPEPHFSHTIRYWEQITNNAGHDVRLLSEIAHKRREALKALGLDVHDTTPREFYHVLQHKAQETNQGLEKHLGVTDQDTPQQTVEKIVRWIESLNLPRDVWTIKPTIIKQILKKQAPKKVMKLLGVRSIDSVLKRSSASELLSLGYQIESPEWKKKVHQQIKKLTPTNFQTTKSCIYIIDESRVEKLHKGGYNRSKVIVPAFEAGTILLVPSARRFKMDTLAITAGLLQALHEQRQYSSYFRHISVRADFGELMHSILDGGLPGKPRDLQIGWKVLQRHFNRNPAGFSRLEQPHLHWEDIELAHPLQPLAVHVPSGGFWAFNDHVFMHDDGKPVSGHLIDVIVNASNQLPYERRHYGHLQALLWEELGLRYLQNPAIEAIVIEEIDADPYNG